MNDILKRKIEVKKQEKKILKKNFLLKMFEVKKWKNNVIIKPLFLVRNLKYIIITIF